MYNYRVGSLTAKVIKYGDGFIIIVGGGEEHLGAISLGEPYTSHEKISASISTLTRFKHRDDTLSGPIAQKLAATLNLPVLVIAGFHKENICKEELAQVLKDSTDLTNLLQTALQHL